MITGGQWYLVDLLTPFIVAPLMLVAGLLLPLLSLASLVYLAVRFGRSPIRAFAPLAINITTLLTVTFVPLHSLALDLQFAVDLPRYSQVIALIEESAISPDEWGRASLPERYESLSRGGGDIIIERAEDHLYVFFYTYRGILDNFSGFMYRSDGSAPRQYDLGGDWQEIEPLRPNWFFCASY